MIKKLREAFPFHKVHKIIRESANRKAVYAIEGAASGHEMAVQANGRAIERLGMDWQIVNRDIHCWK